MFEALCILSNICTLADRMVYLDYYMKAIMAAIVTIFIRYNSVVRFVYSRPISNYEWLQISSDCSSISVL